MSLNSNATFEEQYEALRTGCGLVELPNWSSIVVTGADRQSFIHNFCTNDVKRLKPGESCEAFFTNVKGKIVGHGIVSCRDEELVIIGVPGAAPPLIAHLDRYLIREDVQLHDATAERRYFSFAGGTAAGAHDQIKEKIIAVVSAVVPCSLVGSPYERLIEVLPHDSSSFAGLLQTQKVIAATLAFEAARIEAGVPLFLKDFDKNNFPQEVRRDREAISFTKGCYLGQETVARIDALGHVNQQIVGVRFFDNVDIVPEMELSRDGNSVGQVSSWAFSPQLNAPLALAMVRREANAVGTQLDSLVGKCEVIDLPLPADS